MVESRKLEVGEKYLTVEVNLGVLGVKKFGVFKNVKTKPGSPDFKSKDAAVWVNVKKAGSGVDVVVEDVV